MSKRIRPIKVLTEQQIADKANKDFRTVTSLWQLLQKDAFISRKEMHAEQNEEFHRYRERVFVRSVFAMIEGTCFGIRWLCIQGHDFASPTEQFTEQDLRDLKEVDEEGGKKFLQFRDSVKKSFAACRVFGCKFQLKTDHQGYKALLECKELRDHLMHPKSVGSLVIPASSISKMEYSLDWFNDEFARFRTEMGRT